MNDRKLVLTSFVQIVRHVAMLEGVTVSESKNQKDELILEGTDVQNVSQSGEFFFDPQCKQSGIVLIPL